MHLFPPHRVGRTRGIHSSARAKQALLISLGASLLPLSDGLSAEAEAQAQKPAEAAVPNAAPDHPEQPAPPAQTEDSGPALTEKWLTQIREEFQTVYRSGVEMPFENAVNTLQERYIRLLNGLLTAPNAAAEQEEKKHRREEEENFIARGRTLPEADGDTRSEAIKMWRADFREKLVQIKKEREERGLNLQARYDDILAKNEAALLQRGRLAEAGIVKDARDKFLSEWLQPAGKIAAAANAREEEQETEETPEQFEQSRAAMVRSVRWLLAIGAELRIKERNRDRPLTEADQLPGGRPRFSLVALDRDALTMELGEGDLDRLAPLRGASKLVLKQIDVGDRALRFLEEWKGLEELSIEGGGFTDDILPQLERFDTLRRLSIRSAPHVTAKTAACLARMHNLQSICLAHSGVTDIGAGALSELRRVTQLDLSYTPIKDAGLARLADMHSLRSLKLDQCGVTDAGLQEILKLRKIELLSLSGTPVTDAGISALCNLGELESLDLSRLEITGKGLERFSQLRKLTRLNLSGTKVTDSGIEHLSEVHSLRFLDIRKTQVTAKGVASLASLHELERLDFLSSTLPGFAEAVQSVVKNCPRLESLEITGPELQAEQIEGLADLHKLKSLSLPAVTLGPGAAEVIGKILGLETLLLPNGNFSDAEVDGLLRLRNLSRLDLSGTAITDEGLAKIKGLKSLRELHVARTAVSPTAEEQSEKSDPELRITR
jgi:internalin A